jgi:hypothetical protein
MRSLKRNKITFWYALFSDKIPVKDEWGNETGQFTNGYLNPVKTRQRVSPNKGEANAEAFGLTADYDRVIITTDTLPFDEMTVLWINTVPVLNEDGSTNTPHDFKVVKVAPDLNVKQYAIKKVVN